MNNVINKLTGEEYEYDITMLNEYVNLKFDLRKRISKILDEIGTVTELLEKGHLDREFGENHNMKLEAKIEKLEKHIANINISIDNEDLDLYHYLRAHYD
ncbi:hypothetical protein ACP6H4_23865 [Vibrio harveyi]|uniref:hypothetical protein n=1 Tax=Vibrio harveyi group TaxID=717610 RepID=UPI00215CA0CB|nr:hypothetical protein [Vibrio parahaemolyticus]MCR9839698.1 hypothetical protein [Vibrio parahaemolyticus]